MSHDSTDCPQNNPNDEEAPHDDNNDDDNAYDGRPPSFSTPEHHDPVDPVIPPSDNQHDAANHDSTPSKKRKTEPSVPMVELNPLCYETRQGMIYEEVTEQVLKRMRRQAETCEGRQWFQAVHDQEASSSRASPQGPHKTNDREGGGLALLWNKDIDIVINAMDERMFDCVINNKNGIMYFTCVYGHPIRALRHHFWEKLQRIATTRKGPWLLCGDFNEILKPEEKIGGPPREPWSMMDFNLMTKVCRLQDLPFSGNNMTWAGNRKGHKVQSWLDRGFGNDEFRALYPASRVIYLEMIESDHRPAIIQIRKTTDFGKKSFCFDNRLTEREGFKEVIIDGWKSTLPGQYVSVSDRIRKCRHAISQWKKANNTNSAKHIKALTALIDEAHSDPLCPLSEIHNLRSPDSLTTANVSLLNKLETIFSFASNNNLPNEQKLLPFWVVWRLWECRNDLLFNKIKYTADEVISKARVDLKEWLDSTISSQITNSTERTRSENIRSHWSPPPSGWVKCNYDSAHREGSQDSGMGWLVRNNQGTLLEAGMGIRTINSYGVGIVCADLANASMLIVRL
ncbi:hypothetical protein Bca4012_005466 [Brassica carinata]